MGETREATAAIFELMESGSESVEERSIALGRLALADEALDLVRSRRVTDADIEDILSRMQDAAQAARRAEEADHRLGMVRDHINASEVRESVGAAWSQMQPATEALMFPNERDEEEEDPCAEAQERARA